MAEDVFKPRGPLKSSKPDAGGANIYSVPVIGIVKDNIDPTKAGRIRVYISDQGTNDSDSSENWISVGYLSTFFGKVEATAPTDGHGTYKGNPSSYGQWQAPPDIGTQVLCIFVNGDPNYGYYIGCIPEPESLHMVPAIGAAEYIVPNEGEAASYGGAVRLPVTNINTNDSSTTNREDFNDAARPVHSYTAAIMNQQGIIRDPIRGPISSSASRETMSRVGWGVSSPGRPIYEGGYDDQTLPSSLKDDNPQGLKVVARRGGHSIVMDDGDIIGRDQLIRIRTSLGHQILMSDDGQTMMLLHSNGQSYVELGKEGTIDLYSTNSVNIRTHGDLNLHADRDVNIHAAEKFNVQAKNIHTNSEEVTQSRAGTDYKIASTGNFTGLAGGGIAFGASGDASLAAGGSAYINGSKVNLNSGSSSLSPAPVLNIPLNAQTDTLYDAEKGFIAAPGKLLSIVSRAPAHAPWANAGQGVDIKVDLNESSQLPAAPSTATQELNAVANASGVTAPSSATIASVPTNVPAVSASLDKQTTSAVLGATAATAAASSLSAAVKSGAAIVSAGAEKILAVGSYATPIKGLEAAGIIKPGAATMVNGLINSGKNLAQSIPAAVFTGQAAAANITAIASDVTSQTKIVVNTMQQAQTTLTKVGAITGKEAPQQIAGLVSAGASLGVKQVTGALQQVSGSVQKVTGALNGLSTSVSSVGGVLKAVGLGNISASIGGVSSAMRGVSSALNAMNKIPALAGLIDQSRGIAAAAFSAIKNSFGKLKPNQAQNLAAGAKGQATATTAAAEATAKSLNVVASSTNATTATLDAGAISTAASIEQVAPSMSSRISVSSVTNAGDLTQIGMLPTTNNDVSSITGSAIVIPTSVTTGNVNATTVGGVTASTNSTSATSGIKGAVTNVSAAAGAASAMASGGIPALAEAATVVQKGAAASASATLASGINNITGGINTTVNVVNNATSVLSVIPGTSELRNTIRDVTSTAMKGASVLNAVSSIAAGKSGSLAGIVAGGLKVGGLAQLQSAIASLGGGSVKLPSVGFNTTERNAITQQIRSVLGDPGIPQPNLVGEISEATSAELQSVIDAARAKKAQLKPQLNAAKEKRNAAKNQYTEAKKTLPQGDPELVKLYNEYVQAETEYDKIYSEYAKTDIALGMAKLEKLSPGAGKAVANDVLNITRAI